MLPGALSAAAQRGSIEGSSEPSISLIWQELPFTCTHTCGDFFIHIPKNGMSSHNSGFNKITLANKQKQNLFLKKKQINVKKPKSIRTSYNYSSFTIVFNIRDAIATAAENKASSERILECHQNVFSSSKCINFLVICRQTAKVMWKPTVFDPKGPYVI